MDDLSKALEALSEALDDQEEIEECGDLEDRLEAYLRVAETVEVAAVAFSKV